MRRIICLLILIVLGVTACGRGPGASSAASTSALSTASPSPAPSVKFATDSYPSAPHVNNGYLGNGVYGTPLLVSGSGRDLGTWYWDGAAWVRVSAQFASYFVTRPVFDPLLRKSVALSGGWTGDPVTTWAWNGTSWSSINANSPGSGAVELGFDAATNQLVAVLGDVTASKTSTWLLEGTQWQRAGSPAGPTARAEAGFAYDPGSKQLVLVGGMSYFGLNPHASLADTWTWDGKAWAQQHPVTNPPAGWDSLAYDPDSHQLILVNVAVADATSRPSEISMWSWDGADWHQLSPNRLPALGPRPAMTYDPADHRLILFVPTFQTAPGLDGSQTWSYQSDSWTRIG